MLYNRFTGRSGMGMSVATKRILLFWSVLVVLICVVEYRLRIISNIIPVAALSTGLTQPVHRPNNPPTPLPVPSLPLAETDTQNPLEVYTLSALNIKASFVPYGARLVSLLVPDRHGLHQDVVLGYDAPEDYVHDTLTNHTYFGPVVGRYANRIRNGTFKLNGKKYNVPRNENGGLNTLHGGDVGYDQRNWTVLSSSATSISFGLLDDEFEGFPGKVFTNATYTVGLAKSGPKGELRPRLTSTIISYALDKPTPIMLINHIYWNLNAFRAADVLNDTTLHMPYSDRYIEVDGILVPTGKISDVKSVPALDFTSPRKLDEAISEASGVCGTGCTGIDNGFIVDRTPRTSADFPVLTMMSNITGIKMDVSTNQIGLQIYTCNNQDGSIAVKKTQQNRNKKVPDAVGVVNKYGCVVIEPQAWVDGINHPEWEVDEFEIFSKDTKPAVNYATYDFSTFR